MLRRCDGDDPYLVKLSPTADEWDGFTPAKYVPCSCGKVFDDVEYSVLFPHGPVGGYVFPPPN